LSREAATEIARETDRVTENVRFSAAASRLNACYRSGIRGLTPTATCCRRFATSLGHRLMPDASPLLSTVLAVVVLLTLNSRTHADDPQPAASQTNATFAKTVKPFLATYCLSCHGPKQQKGDRRFDGLTGTITDDNSLVDLQDILDQLNLSEMPPPKSKQPSPTEVKRVVAWLTKTIREYQESRKGSGTRPVLRRLNAREYQNSIRDLLHIDMTMFNPAEFFPRDQTSDHLDNVGDTLVTSGYLLAKYLEAADRVVEKVLNPRQQPEVQKWHFKDSFRQQPEIDQVFRRTNKFAWMTLFDVIGADKHEGAYGPIHAFADGVPFDGTYEIRLKAQAVNRINPYDPAFLGTDPSEPLRLGIRPGNKSVGALHKPQPVEPLLVEIDLADEMNWYSVRVHLDAGYTPRFTFRNGLMDVRNLWANLLKKYPKDFPKKSRGIVENRYNAISLGKLPQIQIHEIEISGPYFDEWPTPSQRALLGEDCETVLTSGEMTRDKMRQQLSAFASRAYRRPITTTEVDRLLQIADVRKQAGRSSLEAYGDTIKAVLCSPAFLYLQQPDEESESEQPPVEKSNAAYLLATRLSYFLWSSTPDTQLLELAASGELTKSDVLSAQVDRLLDDPRSDAFVDGFLGSWLGLRDLGSMPPDRTSFRTFYHYDLDSAMRRETQLFTRHLLDENLSIGNFLDSDFTFVNKPLARHYGIKPPGGTEFERVSLPDRRRGGLLGQASVLTVTANGIDTSPVVRGVWLLENLLGTPAPAPPPDVEPLDPDVRGTTTIRQRLEKHRSNPACYDCHRRIDPMGWALENFDPVGKWRNSYGKSPIDPSGELPNGESYRNVEDFKRLLLERKDVFATGLTRKLLEYSTGRHMTISDRDEIDDIVAGLRTDGDGFRDLIHAVIQSDPFRVD
jgi:mono/diheme cytochrome c family protein